MNAFIKNRKTLIENLVIFAKENEDKRDTVNDIINELNFEIKLEEERLNKLKGKAIITFQEINNSVESFRGIKELKRINPIINFTFYNNRINIELDDFYFMETYIYLENILNDKKCDLSNKSSASFLELLELAKQPC